MNQAFSEVTEHGVLWRMHRRNGGRFSCRVREVDGVLFLAIRDLDTGQVHVAESCPDVASLVGRAASAHTPYLDEGWRVCN